MEALAEILPTLAPLAVVLVVLYFAFIRPSRKKDRERREMLDNLRVGDRVTTIGGVFGEIVRLREDTATLRVADDVDVLITRSAVRFVLGKEREKGK